MKPVALICNPFSDGNCGTAKLAEYAAALPDVLTCAPRTPAELETALRDFALRDVAAIAVDGGDGTLREVMSRLPEAFGPSPPPLALLPSGKTNLAAGDVGSFGSGRAGLSRLLDAVRHDWRGARWSERPSLEVTWPDQPQRRVRGLLFGAGAFTHATRMAGRWAHDHGFRQRTAVAIGVARVMWESLGGSDELADPALCPIIDGVEVEGLATPCFLLLATTARRLMLGLWPFPPPSDSPSLSWLRVSHPPRRLALGLWKAWRGQLPDPALGFNGGLCQRLDLRLHGAFVIDGELYEAGPEGVTLRTGPSFHFVAR
ncbi:MAG: diacylglycerol kinase family protein [Magnetospirillum sp.]